MAKNKQFTCVIRGYVPADLYKKAKEKASREGTTISEVLRKKIQERIKTRRQR